MQQTKGTKTIGKFQKFLDNDNKTGLCLEDALRFFEIQRIFGHFECIKQRGIRVTLIMTSLLVMLFYKSRNIHSYFTRQFGKYTGLNTALTGCLVSVRMSRGMWCPEQRLFWKLLRELERTVLLRITD